MSEINPELYLSFAYKEPLMLFGFFGFKKKKKKALKFLLPKKYVLTYISDKKWNPGGEISFDKCRCCIIYFIERTSCC